MIKRVFAIILALLMLLSVIPAGVSAAGSTNNSGTRHEICNSLSTQAVAYYTGNHSWDAMSQLKGVKTDSSVTAAGSPLFNSLQSLMKSTLTTTVSYSSLTSYWQKTDSEYGTSDATLFYSDVTSSSYNREHVWPKSHGNFYQSGAGSDLHHLRPTDTNVNSTRNHWTFGNVREEISSYSTKAYAGKTVLWYNTSYSANDCLGLVEVNDNVKGDVARVLLYVYVTYGKKSGNENLNLCTKTSASGSGNTANTGDKIIEDLDTLLEWCLMDPVDTWEMSRNDCCQNVQGNRNVFIDYPEYAWLLFGRDVPKMITPSGLAANNPGTITETYTLQVVSEDTSKGTVTGGSGRFVAIPAEGYYTSGWTLKPENAAVVTQNGDEFLVSKPTADCTLTIHFAEKQQAAIRFAVPEGVSCEPLTGYQGDVVILPTPKGQPDTEMPVTFLGWTTEPVDNSTERPVFRLPGGYMSLDKEDTVLYALYSYVVSDGTGTLDEFSLSDTVSDGEYVIAAASENQMMCNMVNSTYLKNTYAEIVDDTITNAKPTNIFTFSAVGSSWTIQDYEGAYLRADGEKRLDLDNVKTEVSEADTNYLWAVEIDSAGIASIHSVKSYAYGGLQYNKNSPRFTTYTSQQCGVSLFGRAAGTRYYSTLQSEPIKPCDHLWGEGTIEQTPSCIAGGKTIYQCALCGASKTVTTPALGHDYQDHAGKPAYCNENGWEAYQTCSRCDYSSYKEIPALGHDYINHEAKPATCTEVGWAAYQTCSRCDYTDYKEIAELGHDYVTETIASTETEMGYDLHTCTRCGDSYKDNFTLPVDPICKHTDTEVRNAKAPTCLEPGYTGDTYCVECGQKLAEGEEIPALGHDYVDGICSRCGAEDPNYDPLTPKDPCEGYTDIDRTDWYHPYADFVIENGLMGSTTTDGLTFEPATSCTRSMIVTILYSLAGKPTVEYEAVFPDVADGQWFTAPVMWAYQYGIVSGYDNGKFGPNDKVTREQMAVILKGYADFKGIDTSKSADLSKFPDGNKATWSKPYISWAVAEGLISGKAQDGKTYLDPQGNATRAEVATLISSFVRNILEAE